MNAPDIPAASHRVVFIVNGLGLGNSTRCHAVIQRLKARGAETHIITSDNGLWYFRDRSEVASITEIASLYYAKRNGKISIAGTLSSLRDFRRILQHNAELIGERLAELKPDVVVTDSQYTVGPIRRLGIPLVALNNADVVVAGYRRARGAPREVRPQFYAVEVSDYLFHRFVPDVVISPTLDPSIPVLSDRAIRVGPIVREGYEADLRRGAPRRATIMLSGSAFGSQVHLGRPDYPMAIDIIGRQAPPGWSKKANIEWHGKITDTRPILRETDLAVVNGGFSAISEAFYMRKPIVVVPVPRHAEQWVNARTIESLGVGMMSSEDGIEATMLQALDRIEMFRAAYDRIGAMPDGALQAANIILQTAKGEARS